MQTSKYCSFFSKKILQFFKLQMNCCHPNVSLQNMGDWIFSHCQQSVWDLFALFVFQDSFTAWKVSKYGVFSGPYFPVFRLNSKIYGENHCIQSEYRKIHTRKKICIWTLFKQCLLEVWLYLEKILTNCILLFTIFLFSS